VEGVHKMEWPDNTAGALNGQLEHHRRLSSPTPDVAAACVEVVAKSRLEYRFVHIREHSGVGMLANQPNWACSKNARQTIGQ